MSWVWPSGRKTAARLGESVYLDNKIVTGPNGRIQVLLTDDTVFTVGPNSEMYIDEFVYDPKESKRTIVMRLEKGAFRFVTGKIAPKQPADMKVKLPVAAVGIRGTDFECALPDEVSARITVHSGEVEYRGLLAPSDGPPIVIRAGETRTLDAFGREREPFRPITVPWATKPSWQAADRVADWTGRDAGACTAGATPDAAACSDRGKGTVAVCWDGATHRNENYPGGPMGDGCRGRAAWCTYKELGSLRDKTPPDGTAPGRVFVCE